MIAELTHIISEIDRERIHRLNQFFIKEAIEEWDRLIIGRPIVFPLYIEYYVRMCWEELIRSN